MQKSKTKRLEVTTEVTTKHQLSWTQWKHLEAYRNNLVSKHLNIRHSVNRDLTRVTEIDPHKVCVISYTCIYIYVLYIYMCICTPR